ncbi:MAG TPA: hypothetical protein VMI54_23430 [Polyangiaceae bacterium]|nr:hypothetical protein [Polyangiaceae bacterium]
MALGIVGRSSFIPFAACIAALAQGCFTTSKGDDDSSKGCTKDTDCLDGRICNNGTCMNPDTGGTGGTGAILSGGTSGTTSGTSGTSGTGTKGGTGGSTGGTGSGVGGASGTSGTSSGGTSGMCSATDPATCPTTDSMTFCNNGSELTLTCDYFCSTLGFKTGPCMDGYGCECGDATNQECSDGVNAYCQCVSDSSMPCDQNDPNNDPLTFYYNCQAASQTAAQQQDTDFLKCLAMQITTDSSGQMSIDCGAAATACEPASGGAAGMGGTGGGGGSAGLPASP